MNEQWTIGNPGFGCSRDELSKISGAVAAQGYAVTELKTTGEFLKVAHALGCPVASRSGVGLVQTLEANDREHAFANSLSSRYGRGAFPLHTDLAHWRIPARFILLRAPDESSSTCPTLLLDFKRHLQDQPFESALESLLYLVVNGRKSFLTTLRNRVANEAILRYDRDCLRATNRQSRAILDELEASLENGEIMEIPWSANNVLIIDNWRMLHGRGDARGSRRARILFRILVTEPKGGEPWH